MWWLEHAIISGFLAILYFIFTTNFFSAILIFLVGILMDIDHFIFYHFLKKENFSDIYNRFYKIIKKNGADKDAGKYFLPFHNFEFIIFLIFLSFLIPFFIPVTIGALSHFITDVVWIRNFKLKKYYSFIFYMLCRLKIINN